MHILFYWWDWCWSSCLSSWWRFALKSFVVLRRENFPRLPGPNVFGISSQWRRHWTRQSGASWRSPRPKQRCCRLRWRSRAKSPPTLLLFHSPIRFPLLPTHSRIPPWTPSILEMNKLRPQIGARGHQVYRVYQTLNILIVNINLGKSIYHRQRTILLLIRCSIPNQML